MSRSHLLNRAILKIHANQGAAADEDGVTTESIAIGRLKNGLLGVVDVVVIR